MAHSAGAAYITIVCVCVCRSLDIGVYYDIAYITAISRLHDRVLTSESVTYCRNIRNIVMYAAPAECAMTQLRNVRSSCRVCHDSAP